MARAVPEQDLVLRVGLAMDYANTLGVADAMQAQARAYRRLADELERASASIRDSVAQHKADVAAAEADAHAAAGMTGVIKAQDQFGVYVDGALPPDTAVMISDPGPGEVFDPALHAAVIIDTGAGS